MGVTATPKCIQATSWTHKEREELGGSDKNCFDHLPFTLALINVFCSARKAAKGYDGLPPPEKHLQLHSLYCLKMPPFQTHRFYVFWQICGKTITNMWKDNNKIPNYQDSKLWSGQSG